MSRRFAITFDYLCPFARNGNEHVVEGLRHGADWDVEFLPHSLAQGHVEPGQHDVWDLEDPSAAAGVLALQAGLAVRDHFPERFLEAHEALFAARHDHGRDLKDPGVVRAALTETGVDADAVFDVIAGGEPLKVLRAEHEAGVRDHEIWGVPTFVAGGRAVFARVLDRPEADGELARRRIEQIVDLVVDAPMLHEFKQTDLPM
jgi:protein-disulfide isomerase-like protein with CxxC motif